MSEQRWWTEPFDPDTAPDHSHDDEPESGRRNRAKGAEPDYAEDVEGDGSLFDTQTGQGVI